VPISTLTVGIPKETLPSERRAAATPDSVARLCKAGYTVIVERGLGLGAEISDAAYEAAGARVGSRAEALGASIVTKVRPFTAEEVGALRAGATVVSLLAPAQNKELAAQLAAAGVTALGLDCVPRTLSRAQAFDVLSSQVCDRPHSRAMRAQAPSPAHVGPQARHARARRCACASCAACADARALPGAVQANIAGAAHRTHILHCSAALPRPASRRCARICTRAPSSHVRSRAAQVSAP
jgi:hypothetical protein